MIRMLQALVLLSAVLVSFPALGADLPTSLQMVIDTAEDNGLPTQPLVQKAREGLSKGVSNDRVEIVLSRMAGDLARAKEIMVTDNPELLRAASGAIRLGASDANILALYRLDSAVRLQSLTAYTDLLAVGLGHNQSLQLVRNVAVTPSGPRHLPQIAILVASKISRGATPTSAANDVSTNLGVGPEVGGGPAQSGNSAKAWAWGKAKGGKKRR